MRYSEYTYHINYHSLYHIDYMIKAIPYTSLYTSVAHTSSIKIEIFVLGGFSADDDSNLK